MASGMSLRDDESVRPATESDLKGCAVVLKEWLESSPHLTAGQNYDPNDDHEAFLRGVFKADDEAIFVAVDKDGIQGFVTLRAHRRRNSDLVGKVGVFIRKLLSAVGMTRGMGNSKVGTLDHIVIRPGKRSSYMSLALFRELTAWCRQRGLTAIEGTIWSENTDSLRLGKLLGFKPVRVLVRKELS